MQKGNSARRFVSLGVALIALVALTVSLGAGAASAGPGHAVTSKKKCKKAKKGAVSAKKKKCKHKRATVVTPPATTPALPSGPTTRASITWDTTDQVDMHVYDSSGHHAFYGAAGGIPGAIERDQPEGSLGVPETFADLRSPSTRTFTVYICLYQYDPGGSGSGPVHVTADITDPGGGHRTITRTLTAVDQELPVTVSPQDATAFVPSPGFCHPTI
jgi:hypothetical protein